MTDILLWIWTDVNQAGTACSIQTQAIMDNLIYDLSTYPNDELPYIILTWGYQPIHGQHKEYEVMLQYFQQSTVGNDYPKEKVIIESMSTNTDTNAYYSLLLAMAHCHNIWNILIYSWFLNEKTLDQHPNVRSHGDRVMRYMHYWKKQLWTEWKLVEKWCFAEEEFSDPELNSQFWLQESSYRSQREYFWSNISELLCEWRTVLHSLRTTWDIWTPLLQFLDNVYWVGSTSLQAMTYAIDILWTRRHQNKQFMALYENIQAMHSCYLEKKQWLKEVWQATLQKDS